MNIKIKPTDWAFLIVITCLISGCSIVSGLKHFVPPEGSNLGIEFDYPKNWEWVYRSESSSIYANEPQKPLYTPGQKPSSSLGGIIDLLVYIGANQESQEKQIKFWLDATEAIGGEILEDKMIEIDGVSSRWISRRIPERPRFNLDFEQYSIAVFAYENHNLYFLTLSIPFERREGEFVRDFNKMISTIEFVP
jgi:hypothetical protein